MRGKAGHQQEDFFTSFDHGMLRLLLCATSSAKEKDMFLGREDAGPALPGLKPLFLDANSMAMIGMPDAAAH